MHAVSIKKSTPPVIPPEMPPVLPPKIYTFPGAISGVIPGAILATGFFGNLQPPVASVYVVVFLRIQTIQGSCDMEVRYKKSIYTSIPKL